MSGKQKSRRSFTIEEDQNLTKLVEKYGDKCNWKKIAQKMPNRDARQCRDRWNHYLSPYNNSSDWKIEEDQLLMKLYDENGRKWSSFKSQFPGRTAVNIKSRWYKLNQKTLKNSKIQKSNLMFFNNCNYRFNQSFIYPNTNQSISAFNNNIIMANYSQMIIPNLKRTPKSMIQNASYNLVCTVNNTLKSEKKDKFSKHEIHEEIHKRKSSNFSLIDPAGCDNNDDQQMFNDIASLKTFDEEEFINFFEPDIQSFFF